MLQQKQGDSCTGFELSGVLKREPEPGPLLCGVPEGRGALERMAPFLRLSKGLCWGPCGGVVCSLLALIVGEGGRSEECSLPPAQPQVSLTGSDSRVRPSRWS